MDKGNVDVLIAPWNEMYFNQVESFPESKFKDMVDASSSAFTELESGKYIFRHSDRWRIEQRKLLAKVRW